jgi:hypothetical protein
LKALLDTNIIIHREAGKVVEQDIGILFRWLDLAGYSKCIHPITIEEINKNSNKETVYTILKKIDSYERILFANPLHPELLKISEKYDYNQNDKNDSILLNELFIGRVDVLISQDKKIHEKAEKLGLVDKVFKIDTFLEKIFSEFPELVDYKILNVRKIYFAKIDISDPFFETLKVDYIGFEKWFLRKSDQQAYVTINNKNSKLLSFLHLKLEDENENYSDINPIFSRKRRLKVATFKVISNGLRLGERFMKIIFDNALQYKVQEIYVTIYDHRDEQIRLISLLMQWGFIFHGKKKDENVYVRDFSPNFNINKLKECYPFIKRNNNTYLVSIYESYHTELLPDSILNNESPNDFIENFPHRNGISKVYISRSFKPHPKKGDNLIFYRTGGFYKGVITTLCVVEDVIYDIKSESEFLKICKKNSVYRDSELKEMWNYNPHNRPFIIKFLYLYSFPKRLNMKRLIEMGIFKDNSDAPRGFKSISNDMFNSILKESNSNESFIVD